MKRSVFSLFMLAILCLLTNCTQDDSIISPNQSEFESEDDSVITISTEAELNDFLSSLYPFEYVSPSESTVETRASVTTMKYHGYYRMENYKKNFKMLFTGDAAIRVGVAPGIYIGNTKLVFAHLTINGTFVNGPSPDCGLAPSIGSDLGYIDWNTRGYMVHSNNGTYVDLKTVLLNLAYDMAGRNVDVYFPRRPENLIWNYAVLR